jgi:DNA-binding response OmpR family regulator
MEQNTKKRVLIVDDEKELLEVMKEKLEREGIEVLCAEDGQEGLEVALKEKPDLIMLDIIMPKVDGLSMLKNLRKNEWGKTANIIFLTVVDDPVSVSQIVELGVHDYFVKTKWDIGEVVERVKKKLYK